MSGRPLLVIALAVAFAAFVVWWFGRSERCLAREPNGLWAFTGPEIDLRSKCIRQSSRTFAL